MKRLVAIDIGGTTIKFALWENEKLNNFTKIKTPDNLSDFYKILKSGLKKVANDKSIDGVAISSPGAVNKITGVIEGVSAVPYIHNFNIRKELKRVFKLPLTIENDANCVALAEITDGAGRNNNSIVAIVIGSGIGGSVVINRKIWHGSHLLGGEFGYIINNSKEMRTLSTIASPVELGRRYSRIMNQNYSGQEVLELAKKGEPKAKAEFKNAVSALAQAIFNIQYTLDPEKILIGGAISNDSFFIELIKKEVRRISSTTKIASLNIQISACKYLDESNLRGAVVDFFQEAGLGTP
ncbi:ROK family protein [Pediococcus acidilactici]|uniref:ROK family protein n=1 Tax=Pediococcus acidilactici TaxID=1254 RepID=UPI003857516E